MRRLVVTLVLVLFGSVTIGVVLGLDDAARSDLVGRLPGTGTVASPSAEPVPSATKAVATPKAKTATATPTPQVTSSPPKAKPEPSTTNAAKASQSPSNSASQSSSTRAAEKSTSKATTKSGKSTTTKKKDGGTVYLTFDDGPSAYTPQVLKILSDTGSTATFFQLGAHTKGQGHVIAAIKAQGSNIGNHTFNHPDMTTLSASQLRWQIANGPQEKCFRPPYGATNATVRKALKQAGARQVLWTVDTLDWKQPGIGTLVYYGQSSLVKDGGIILMHDGPNNREQTVAALPQMIKNLQARGFKVRALPYCG